MEGEGLNALARDVIERTALRTVKPRIFEPVWQWAERHVRLSVRTTNTPGKYDSGWIAYTRGWQEAFSNPRVKEIAICAAGQVGKTEALLNCARGDMENMRSISRRGIRLSKCSFYPLAEHLYL